MKKNLFTLCFILASSFSFSQTNSKEYNKHKERGDSLYKKKDYKNSALAYTTAIGYANPNVENTIRWSTASSWSLGNFYDSAFAQLDIIATSMDLTFQYFTDILNDTDFTLLHKDKRWQEIKEKMFMNVNKTILSALKKSGRLLSAQERYNFACAWAVMNNPDSSFYHLGILAKTKDNTYTNNYRIQTDAALVSLHNDQRWQPAVNEIYKSVATTYSSRIRKGNWTHPTYDGYFAATAWALAKEPDSAFYYLDKIINTDYNVFTWYTLLASAPAFSSLQSDKRWQSLADIVKKNFTPFICGHTTRGPALPMEFTIDPSSSFLKSDGKGIYRNNVDKVVSLGQVAYNLLVSGHHAFEESYDKNDLSSRSLILDLNNPVAGSGSVKMGLIHDRDAALHIFYKFDRSVNPMMIYNFREIPIGLTIESPRTEILVHIKGVFYTLHMGTWGLGDCNEPYACKGSINGIGTTMVKITRHSESSYTIVAPKGSIGRLWNTQNMTKPVDMGLFKTGFIIHLEEQ